MARIQYEERLANWIKENGFLFTTISYHDSGNISYGMRADDGHDYFIKFAPADNPEAVDCLENALILGSTIEHPVLIDLHFALDCLDGLALIYDWVDAETINEVTELNKSQAKELRHSPQSPYQRFKSLPVAKMLRILEQIFDLHLTLEEHGYVSCDWYDGCIMYNFQHDRLYIMDLDLYHQGPFVNNMGRMYGSSRFMAPEEFKLGSMIDNRTTVYHLGATVFEFMGQGKKNPYQDFIGTEKMLNVALRAIEPHKEDRYSSTQEFYEEWTKAICGL